MMMIFFSFGNEIELNQIGLTFCGIKEQIFFELIETWGLVILVVKGFGNCTSQRTFPLIAKWKRSWLKVRFHEWKHVWFWLWDSWQARNWTEEARYMYMVNILTWFAKALIVFGVMVGWLLSHSSWRDGRLHSQPWKNLEGEVNHLSFFISSQKL